MLFLCVKCIISAFIILEISFALESPSFYDSTIEILKDESIILDKQQTREESSGHAIICNNSPTQNCSIDTDGSCKCTCKKGYYSEENGGCHKGKIFGGQIKFIDENATSINHDVNDSINLLFNDTENFVQVDIISIHSGSIIVDYVLVYRNVESIDKTSVEQNIHKKLKCENGSNFEVNGLTLDVNSSCETAISDDSKIVCNSSFASCDVASTTCSANEFGYIVCRCLGDFYQLNDTTCVEQVCVFDQDCNSPFGWCTSSSSNINSCTCMWGFAGTNCYQPWLFTLTVVAGGCVVIILTLITALIVCSRKKKSIEKSSQALKPMNDFKNVSDRPSTPTVSSNSQYSKYQPGMMRARMPSAAYDRSNYAANRNNQQMSALQNNKKIGHSNIAYDYISSTTAFNSPRRTPSSRTPSDYF